MIPLRKGLAHYRRTICSYRLIIIVKSFFFTVKYGLFTGHIWIGHIWMKVRNTKRLNQLLKWHMQKTYIYISVYYVTCFKRCFCVLQMRKLLNELKLGVDEVLCISENWTSENMIFAQYGHISITFRVSDKTDLWSIWRYWVIHVRICVIFITWNNSRQRIQ